MNKIILGFLLTMLIGCTTTEEKTKVEYVFITVPAELTRPVQLSVPFNPEHYSVQDWGVKENLLFGLLAERTAEVGVCNARLRGISNWSIKNNEIYNKDNLK